MRIAAIKELVSRYSIDELIQAEEALLDEREPAMLVLSMSLKRI